MLSILFHIYSIFHWVIWNQIDGFFMLATPANTLFLFFFLLFYIIWTVNLLHPITNKSVCPVGGIQFMMYETQWAAFWVTLVLDNVSLDWWTLRNGIKCVQERETCVNERLCTDINKNRVHADHCVFGQNESKKENH